MSGNEANYTNTHIRLLTLWGTTEGLRHTGEVDYDTFDAVALAFNLGLKLLHLVTVKRISNVPSDIDGRHDCGC